MKANAQKNDQGQPDISIVGETNTDLIVYGNSYLGFLNVCP